LLKKIPGRKEIGWLLVISSIEMLRLREYTSAGVASGSGKT
jgi:hypothetical protein